MSLIDTFSKEDRVPVTFTDFFNLVKQAAKYENVMNGVNCNVPHAYIREMTTRKAEEHPKEITAQIVAGVPTADEIAEAFEKMEDAAVTRYMEKQESKPEAEEQEEETREQEPEPGQQEKEE